LNFNNQELIKVNNLWKIFGEMDTMVAPSDPNFLAALENSSAVTAIRDASFTVNKGEIFVIMGLSGSGKSTLIRCLLRLIEPSYGNIIIKGQNIVDMNDEELIEFRRTTVAMVFQHYGLLPHRNVLDNVSFGLKLSGLKRPERDKKALEALEQVGLTGWEKKYPNQLSGGMQQRVGIARALVQDTDILLMDEPFSGLDPLIRREMQEELLRLQKDLNKSIVFVTHDLNEAIRLGDHLAVMKTGSFVQQGTPQEILRNPADDYVRRFVQDERQIRSVTMESKHSKVRDIKSRQIQKVKPLTRIAGGE
jgi:glycine betaine/proline transport system ATP-binding protein